MSTQPKAQPMNDTIAQLIAQHHIHEVECVIPDMTGIARGKILPKDLFLSAGEMRIPKSVLLNTVNGQQPDNGPYVGDTDPDMVCMPDVATARVVPWAAEPVAVVIHDCHGVRWLAGAAVAAQSCCAMWCSLYETRAGNRWWHPRWSSIWWRASKTRTSRCSRRWGAPASPRPGGSRIPSMRSTTLIRSSWSSRSFCSVHRLGVETLIHEAGAGQMEINFTHGDPMELADRVFLFKRTVRETALRHGIFATFMAKPMEMEPGSAMHIHQSILDTEAATSSNAPDGNASPAFFHYIAGLQNYVPQVMPMFAPYVNSYRRLAPYMSAPTNVRWGYDNRTCGIRIPQSTPVNRRVENRVPGVDVNPYLAIAATLACGYQGMLEARQPDEALSSSAWNLAHELPRHLEDAIELLRACTPCARCWGRSLSRPFVRSRNLNLAPTTASSVRGSANICCCWSEIQPCMMTPLSQPHAAWTGRAPKRLRATRARGLHRAQPTLAGARPTCRAAPAVWRAAALDERLGHAVCTASGPSPAAHLVTDADGHTLADFCLGDTGAMFGHSPAPVARAGAAPSDARLHHHAGQRGRCRGRRDAERALWPAVLAVCDDGQRRQPLCAALAARRQRSAKTDRLQWLLPRHRR